MPITSDMLCFDNVLKPLGMEE